MAVPKCLLGLKDSLLGNVDIDFKCTAESAVCHL